MEQYFQYAHSKNYGSVCTYELVCAYWQHGLEKGGKYIYMVLQRPYRHGAGLSKRQAAVHKAMAFIVWGWLEKSLQRLVQVPKSNRVFR